MKSKTFLMQSTPQVVGWRTARLAVWASTVCLAVGAGVIGDWLVALAVTACLFLALLPKGFSVVSGIVFPSGLTTGILVYALAAILLGEVAGFYIKITWWDVGLHLYASTVLSIVGFALVMMVTGGAPPVVAPWVLAVLAFAFSMMVGAMWELMEFTLDAVFGTVTQRSGLPDTMGDMAVNLVGATGGAIAGLAHVTRGARWPLAGLLGRFMDENPAHYPARRASRPPFRR